jgi:nucleoid DNA-binding protein
MEYRGKPDNMTDKEWLVKNLALRLPHHSSIINAVVTHQFEELVEASMEKNSLEVSGFGKFVFNRNKAIRVLENSKKLIAKMDADESISEEFHRYPKGKKAHLKEFVKHLEKRINP